MAVLHRFGWRLGLACVVLFGGAATAVAGHINAGEILGIRTKMSRDEGYLRFSRAAPANSSPNGRNGEERTGWTDARHPSLAGPRDNFNGYDRSDHLVQVASTILRDSAGTLAANDRPTDFDFANKAYIPQSGLSVIEQSVRTINSPAAGNAGSFTFPLTNAAETALMPANNLAAPLINNYYAQTLASGALGETYHPSLIAGAGNEAVFMGNTPRFGPNNTQIADVFAHELGHFLLDGQAGYLPIGTQPEHSSDRLNLMAPGSASAPGANDGRFGPGLPAGFNGAPWDIAQSIEVVGRPMSTNADGSPKVGGVNFIETAQTQRIFNPVTNPALNAAVNPYIQIQDRDLTAGDRADFDFVEDNVLLELAGQGLPAAQARADNHPGAADFMVWEIGAISAPSHPVIDANNGGHDHDTWGQLLLDSFQGTTFHTVDVVSQIARYADSDIFTPNGSKSRKQSALDYDIQFSKDGSPASWVAGKLLAIFNFGWTVQSSADDYLARWVAPFDSKFVRIGAHVGDGHDGNTQIDAIIATKSTLPEPSTWLLTIIGGALLLAHRHRLTRCSRR